MAEQKYSLRLAATDAYTGTFGDFSKKAAKLNEGMKEQRAEIDRLNRAARSADGFEKLSEKIGKTKASLQAARVEQARLGREQQVAAAKVQQLNQQHAEAKAKLDQLQASTESSTAQVRAARVETTRLSRELKTASTDLGKLDSAQDKAVSSVKTLTAAQRAEKNELKGLQAALTAAGVDTGQLASEQKRLQAATTAANAALTAQQAKLKAVSAAQGKMDNNRSKRADLRGQMVETAALGYVATRPIAQAMDMQTAMADVGKVINFGEGEREAMASANLKLSSDRLIASSGMTAVDLAKIEYAAGQSGIGNDVKNKDGTIDQKGKQAAIMDFTRDAAIMGSAFDIGAQEAGETMAGWRASMNLNRAQTLDLADSTNYLGNSFNATAADIASVVKRYGAVGKASGLTPEQTAALSAAFLNPGTEKEIAGTGFKNFTAALTKGEAATKGQKKVWKDLGFDPEDLSKDMQKNAPDTIMRVLQAIKAQPVDEQAAVATQLFGSESIGAIQPLLQNLGEVQRAFDMVKDKSKYATSALGENGSMMQEAAGVANTSRTGWNSFTAKLTRLSTVVGTAMLPAVDAVLSPLGKVVDVIADAAEKFPTVTTAVAVAVGGLAALKVAVLGMKFGGLLLGQGLNKGGLMRAKLDASTAGTALAANQAAAAVTRLNASLNTLGRGRAGGVGAPGSAGGISREESIRERWRARAARRSPGGTPPADVGPAVPARRSRFSRLFGARGRVVAALAATGASAGAAAAPGGSSLGFSGAPPVSGSGGAVRPLPASPDALIQPAATAPLEGAAAPAVAAAAEKADPPAWLDTVQTLADAIPGAGEGEPEGPPGPGGRMAKLKKLGKVGVGALAKSAPLLIAAGLAEVSEADGDPSKVGSAVGGTAGGLAGGWAGASAGAAIGTLILPGVGTAIGGAIGGLVGSIAGEGGGSWLGDKIGSLFGPDRLESPDKVAGDLAEGGISESKSMTFSPSLTIQPSGDPAYDKKMGDDLFARLKAEFMPMLMGDMSLGARRSASLTDGGS
ncbi:phage tail tape measure protein [Pseudomonas gessardii]|uniref:Phage tail tape measure protein n=1 Tax=Pseudomonas gessardii TaxID=78544 RepID=A0ABS9FBE9_9PSED|nr:phage tail tape measure protein [Pseudomonas gessardii]MCF4980760.1 phage tail tape measure protein [Pseudomonas gessardii]MCF4988479.1 phage tail tape measure protein [Pseudomonas gessardii]MCF5097490.1 phage tail tape measure protein [Pseudomonas gessardii]MCF5109671.1 phage tail tape measure protein [Pseudomonas gessardii]